MRNLAIELRPQSLDEMVGIPGTVEYIKSQLASGRTPNVWLFIGEPGTGKSSLAYILSREVQGPDFTGQPEIEEINGASENGIDTIRELIPRTEYNPLEGKYRSIIINEVHKLTDPAQQALLVPTEKPNSPTVWFLTTADPSRINAALLSRCGAATYKLKGLDATGRIQLIEKVLKATGTSKPGSVIIKLIEEYGVTSGRDIVNMVEAYSNGVPLVDLVPMGEGDPVYQEIAQAVNLGCWNLLRTKLLKMKATDAKGLRQVISNRLRFNLLTVNGDSGKISDVLKKLALYASPEPPCDLGGLVGVLYDFCK